VSPGAARDEDLRREGRTRTLRVPPTTTGRGIGDGGIDPRPGHFVSRQPPRRRASGAGARRGLRRRVRAVRPGLTRVRKLLTAGRTSAIGTVRTTGGTFCGIDTAGEISPATDERIEPEAYPTEHSLKHRPLPSEARSSLVTVCR
jgi:hypothetical protein